MAGPPVTLDGRRLVSSRQALSHDDVELTGGDALIAAAQLAQHKVLNHNRDATVISRRFYVTYEEEVLPDGDDGPLAA